VDFPIFSLGKIMENSSQSTVPPIWCPPPNKATARLHEAEASPKQMD